MKRHEHLYVLASNAAVVWHESGENPAVFCYLITWDVYATLRSQLLDLIPNAARHETSCWNPSFTSSAPSTAPTVFEN
jgi:hypothetical protein